MSLEEIRAERVKKLDSIKEKGFEAYPAETERTHSASEAVKKFAYLTKSKKYLTLTGRILACREHGGSTFIDLYDGTGKVQVYFKKDLLGESYDFFLQTGDIGDFIEASGDLFKTQKEEKTLLVKNWRMLSKSLLPLPEKWHGLQDVEERFRKRYLDLLINEGVRERFELRTKIIKSLREFLDTRDFLEVETPLLHPVPGGALAKPFVTHHNALDTDLYLRVAPELYLKRLLVGGFEKVYEIGRNFRNEGISSQHNPEFTMLECYAAFWSEQDMMGMVENLFLQLVGIVGKKENYNPALSEKGGARKPFPRLAFKEVLKRYAQIMDYDKETKETLATRARQLGIDVAKYESKGKIADEIYKKICRPYLTQPTFVVDHPLEISPLAKQKSENKSEVRRFQLIVGGLELANAFAELNDPLEQRKRFEEQEKERAGGEEEAHRVDEDFIEALEYGMPPAAGLGVGIDRLVMFLTDVKNIKEVLLFPTMKTKRLEASN